MNTSFDPKNIPTEDTILFWMNGYWFLHSGQTVHGRGREKQQQKKTVPNTIRTAISVQEISVLTETETLSTREPMSLTMTLEHC